MNALEVEFPFKIKGVRPRIRMDARVSRKEDLVSFSIEYDIDLAIDNAELKSKEDAGKEFLYVYKFADLDGAVEFMESGRVRALQGGKPLDVEKVEREMDAFMEKYEAGERELKKKKKTLVVGEDGFMKYV